MCTNVKREISVGDGAKYVDESIAAGIRALNISGHETISSCAGEYIPGDGCRVAYVRFTRRGPEDLEKAARNAGFFITRGLEFSKLDDGRAILNPDIKSLRIASTDPGLFKNTEQFSATELIQANQSFRQLLDDYVRGCVDTSGVRYKNPLSFKYSFEMR